MTFSKRIYWPLLGLFCLCFALPSWALEPAAQVLFSHGGVTATNAEGERPLAKDNPIFSGDTVNTTQDGRAQLRFTDDALVSLMPNSTFAVDAYLAPSAKDSGAISMSLVKGGLRTITGSIGKQNHENYELKTPVATLGIRGTEYVVVLDEDTLRLKVDEGVVSLHNPHGQLNVRAGQSAEARLGQAPQLSDTAPVFNSASRPPLPTAPTEDTELADGPRLAKELPLEVINPSLDANSTARYVLVEHTALTSNTIQMSLYDDPMQVSPSSHELKHFPKSRFDEYHDSYNGDFYFDVTEHEGISIAHFEDYDSQHNLFAWGPEATGLTNADLHFSLAKASPVIEIWANDDAAVGDTTLEQFDLSITGIGGQEANFGTDIQFAFSGDPTPIYKGNQTGEFNLNNGIFSFSEMELNGFQNGDLSCEQCGKLDAAGLVSGTKGENAGVIYKATLGDNGTLTGAAILEKTDPTIAIPGP